MSTDVLDHYHLCVHSLSTCIAKYIYDIFVIDNLPSCSYASNIKVMDTLCIKITCIQSNYYHITCINSFDEMIVVISSTCHKPLKFLSDFFRSDLLYIDFAIETEQMINLSDVRVLSSTVRWYLKYQWLKKVAIIANHCVNWVNGSEVFLFPCAVHNLMLR